MALLGIVVTWTFMLRMASADMARYPDASAWARDSNLFFDAYRRVTRTPAAWWWSEHLMGWALTGTLWLSVEGRRRALRFWAYLWVAMCIAVSVALPIFAETLRAEKVVRRGAGMPPCIAIGVVVAALALAATPFVTDAWFVTVILVLHVALLIPAIATPRLPGGARGASIPAAAHLVAFTCLAIHAVATYRLRATPVAELVRVVARDPAQASITSDAVLTWFACTLYVATARGKGRAVAFAVTAPIASLGAAFAWSVLLDEGEGV
jgi:hypothetical protein